MLGLLITVLNYVAWLIVRTLRARRSALSRALPEGGNTSAVYGSAGLSRGEWQLGPRLRVPRLSGMSPRR